MSYKFPSSSLVLILRGLTHACPRCGSHKTHKNYFSIREKCPRCDLKFEREPGYWTGALVINFIVTGGIVIIGLVVGLITTAPDIPVVTLISILVPIAVLGPIISYPFTFTTWMGFDYAFLSRLDI